VSFKGNPLRAKAGANRSWANTPNRSLRTRNGAKAGPGSVDYHLARLDPAKFADATDEQRYSAAASAQRAHMQEMALKSAEARRRRSAA
jgi:hypothetical protein